MSKKDQTTQSRTQVLETCIRELREVELKIRKLYPRVGTQIVGDFTDTENEVAEYIDYSVGAYCHIISVLDIETRKEANNG